MNTTEAMQTPTQVWINGRFLERSVTGVERVGFEIINALANNHLDGDGCWRDGDKTYRFGLLAPTNSTATSPWSNIELKRTGRFSGHAWEQLDLPRLTRNDWLINLCNTGPLFKRRQLVFLHDAQPFAIPKNFSARFRWWYQTLFRIIGRRAARVLVNSRFTRSELHRYAGIAKTKMDVCHLGTEHVERVEPVPDLDRRFALPASQFVLAVSSANPNKNFAAVLSALEQLGDAAPPCVIVGQRNQEHFDHVALDTNKIHHLGYVSDGELQALYQRALCLVFPSFYEGFGLPPLEAMVQGCPVVAANASAMPEVCGDSIEYCDPHDSTSLARAIRKIHASATVREAMAQAGRRRSARFSWAAAGDAVLRSLTTAVTAL